MKNGLATVNRTISIATTPPADARGSTDRFQLLRRFIEAYWLRPENALWMTLRSEALNRCALEHPSVDVACGDGVFSFLHLGGAFDPDFDVFTSVGHLDGVTDGHADMFDHVERDYRPTLTRQVLDTFDAGVDIKPAMLRKAGQLGVYDRLVEHDGNSPLPFEDHAFQTAYSNAAYWVRNIDAFLGELRRITGDGGKVVLQVKLDSMKQYNLSAHRDTLGDRFLEIIGRGRLDCWPSLCNRATWESRFKKAGLCVEECTPFVTETHARLWDIGLRPIAPLLVKMTQAIEPTTRAAIKREWVDLFCDLLAPLCRPDLSLSSNGSEAAEVQYVLTPKA